MISTLLSAMQGDVIANTANTAKPGYQEPIHAQERRCYRTNTVYWNYPVDKGGFQHETTKPLSLGEDLRTLLCRGTRQLQSSSGITTIVDKYTDEAFRLRNFNVHKL